MYKIKKDYMGDVFIGYVIIRDNQNGSITSFNTNPANTDYANFKREINEGTAQLQDADGNLMTAEQAKDFVKELP